MAPLAQQITGDWPRVVQVWEEFRTQHGYYLRAEVSADQQDFLRQALWQAHGGGHLRTLLLRLHEAGLTGLGLSAAAAPFVASGFQLQSYVNGAWEPQDALITGRRYLQACEHVCRISVNGEHKGTGVLVRPTVVATAAHVVETLVDPTTSKALKDSVNKLAIHFFHADDMLEDGTVTVAQPMAASLMEDWLGHISPPADGEGGPLYPIDSVEGISMPGGPWDFALIRLAATPRVGLRGYPLWDEEPQTKKFGIHVLHHPAQALGRPMGLLWSIGEMKETLGSPMPLRWLHDANTDGGSSGAPCFNTEWKIVALHQAGAGQVAALNQRNRAVPIHGWARQVDTLSQVTDTTPYLTFAVDGNRIDMPVFGRRLLQRRAWAAMTAIKPLVPEQRAFVVLGDTGSGMTFSAAILGALARQAGCPLASLDVRNALDATPQDFALQVLGALGAARPDAASLISRLTTELRDVRNEVVPRLGQAIEALAEKKPVWLVLDGLEACDVGAQGPAHVIEGLLGTLGQIEHLMLGLIRWKGEVRCEHIEVLPSEPAVADIVDHLLLSLAPPGFQADALMRGTIDNFVRTQLAQQTTGSPYERAAAAAQSCRAILGSFIASAMPAGGGGA